MAREHWTERVSDYVDGELDGRERAACEAHLEDCAACRRAFEEVARLVEDAALLPDVPPSRDRWPDIEAQLAPRGRPTDRARGAMPRSRRRLTFTLPQLAAAAIALVLLSWGGAWLLLPALPESPVAAAPDSPAMPAVLTGYGDVVLELEREFDRRRDSLDPETVRIVESNLRIIDAAIAEAGQALSEEPSSGFLQTHLAAALRQKVDLLRRVAAIDHTET